ncbi:MAG: DNA repair protein RadC [Muribaculaceae bacterium]|nr:DNA repair protein RadC [Muribaculaceae bacterium]
MTDDKISIPVGMRIADMPEADKPREKAMAHGVGSLTDSELIAILLGSGLQGKSVVQLSREILARCGDRLGTLSRMTIGELMRDVRGIGPAKAITLLAAIELGSRCRSDLALQNPQITSSEAIFEYMRPSLERVSHEEFWMLILNRANRVMSKWLISQGGMASTVVDVRLLFKKAIDQQASSIVLVHNHPSGALRPSPEDDKLTRRIKDGASLLDIRVLDHLIVSAAGYYSYHDEGRLSVN